MGTKSTAVQLPAHFRPTLVIGLGGTGHRIVLHLKAHFCQVYGEPPGQSIRFLVFDTADEALNVSLDGETISLEPDREFFHIGHTPVPNIIHNLDRQPAIAARLPAIHAIPAVALRNGARQLRPLGALALLWRFEEVEQRMGDAIWALAGKESLGRREGQTQGINVFICNSLVGGTGAGMFLDIAYLARDLFTDLGSMGHFCYITGVGVLPQAFRSVEGPNLVPNAVAALKELSHCMLRGGFSSLYPNGRLIQTPNPPFDLFYLIDGVDEQGHTWRGVSDLAAMAASGLFLQIGSQVGLKGENDFDNLSDVLSRQTADDEGTFCGSFGMATLRFPAAEVAEWGTARLAGAMIAEGLLKPSNEASAGTAARDFTKAQWAALEDLPAILMQDDEGMPLVVDPGAAAWLYQPGRTIAPAEVIRYIQDYTVARVQGDYRAWLRANGQVLAQKLTAALETYTSMALRSADVGVTGTLAQLAALHSLLTARMTMVGAQRATAESDRRRLDLELHGQEEALRQAADTLFLWRGRALAAARERYLDSATAMLNAQMQVYVGESALAVLNALNAAVATWQRRLEQVQAVLAAAHRQLVTQETTWLARQSGADAIAGISLADPDYMNRLYARYASPVFQTVTELLREKSPSAWDTASPDAVLADLCAVAGRPFTSLAALTVEDVLREQSAASGAATSPEAYKERLVRLAAPSWNLDLTRLEDGGAYLQTIKVLGVPDDATSLFREHTRMLVSTSDPTTITAFVATIGAPLSALQQYPDYLRQYQIARRTRVLHILPQFQTEGAQAKLAFALGVLYDLIFNRGVYFYYRPEDSLDAPVRLDSGLENAVRSFAQSDTLVQTVMTRVEQRIAETGTMAALERLTAYYQTDGNGKGGNGADGLATEMRKLVRAYTEELRSAQQVFGVS